MKQLQALMNSADARMHAAIVTIPDPVATRLGRSFDLEVAALISAFEVRNFVLQTFWLTWPTDAKAEDTKSRSEPSVLVFRKDVWRRCLDKAYAVGKACAGQPSVEYYILLLVGESPTTGIYQEAFVAAAQDVVALETPCAARGTLAEQRSLNVIGPSFSGSMQSLMDALDRVAGGDCAADQAEGYCTSPHTGAGRRLAAPERLTANVLSPSATVQSNKLVDNATGEGVNQFPHVHGSLDVSYHSVAADQCTQLQALVEYLNDRHIDTSKIAFLVEESSFGLGQSECFTEGHPTTMQFPQNIASIRAEHAKLTQPDGNAAVGLSLPSKFLELDMSGVDIGQDLPPPYQSGLSSRSDELVLHQMLDALAMWNPPAATVIVATDIRDRLFLLNEIRAALPATLPVVLEADNLMVHPDYRQLTRGSVVIGGGDSLVCIDYDPAGRKEVSCRKESRHLHLPPSKKPFCAAPDLSGGPRQYFPFATDYAANMFRAALLMTAGSDLAHLPATCPQPMVATLAGFQPLDFPNDRIPPDAQTLGMLLSSENHANLWRVSMPVLAIMLFGFALIAIWVGRDPTGIRVLMPLPRHTVHALGRRASDGLKEACAAENVEAGAAGEAEAQAASGTGMSANQARSKTVASSAIVLLALAAGGCAIALWRTVGLLEHSPDSLFFVHGRDSLALLIVAAVTGCVILISALRVMVWNQHCRELAEGKDVPQMLKTRLEEGGYFRGLLGAAALLVGLAASAEGWSATMVDPQLLPGLLGAIAIGSGAYFLVQLFFQLVRLQWLGRELVRSLPKIQTQTGLKNWPSPQLLRQSPTNPLNLVMHMGDAAALRNRRAGEWATMTFKLLHKDPVFDVGRPAEFEDWQRYLIAQMKAGASTLRACTWAAIIAPVGSLVMLQVHPCPFERAQTLAAIGLMGVAFCAFLIATVRLEKDILLGRMFTQDKDRVSFGETFAAILPKLIVIVLALVSMFAPDLLSWVTGLTKVLGGAMH